MVSVFQGLLGGLPLFPNDLPSPLKAWKRSPYCRIRFSNFDMSAPENSVIFVLFLQRMKVGIAFTLHFAAIFFQRSRIKKKEKNLSYPLLINIYFQEQHICIFCRQRSVHGGAHLAWTTPSGIKINYYKFLCRITKNIVKFLLTSNLLCSYGHLFSELICFY